MTHRLRFALVAAVAALALTGCWTTARGGPGNTGEQLSESALSPATVGSLALQWRATGTGRDGPAVADATHVFVQAGSVTTAYPYDGGSDCSGIVCIPEWSYAVGGTIVSQPTPALAGGNLYGVSPDRGGLGQSELRVFPSTLDASCAVPEPGAPPSCPPVWTAPLPGQFISGSPPIVESDRVYVATSVGFAVFDARGVTNCSGLPKVCTPLWTGSGATVRGVGVTVSNGHVYLPVEGFRILAFDATGVDGCTGAPGVCTPQFELRRFADPTFTGNFGPVAVKLGTAVASADGLVASFDATGASCTGTPKVCLPRWQAADAATGLVAVDQDHVYFVANHQLVAYDRRRGGHCSGKPVVCTRVWSAPGVTVGSLGGPSVANGVVYVPTLDNHLFAFATAGCPTTSDVCAPLVDRQLPGSSPLPPVIAQGHVVVGSDATSETFVYGLPAPAST